MVTTGQQMANTLCRYFEVGPRTRRVRDGQNLPKSMKEAIIYAATMPGYFGEETEKALRVGYHVVSAWMKHVDGYRIPGEQIAVYNQQTPYQFAQTLARMVDEGVTNAYEAESWFRKERRQ